MYNDVRNLWKGLQSRRCPELATYGIRRIVEQTRHARGVAEAAISEAMPVHGQVESKVASVTAQAEASTAHVVDALSKYVTEVAAHSAEQTLHVVGIVSQQLEKEIEAVVVSAAAMSERHTCSTVEGLRNEVKCI